MITAVCINGGELLYCGAQTMDFHMNEATAPYKSVINDPNRLGFLDGLRGLAALWVFLGHAAHFSQWTLPLISRPGFAVNLFMLLSGFLMFYQSEIRTKKEPLEDLNNWKIFWVRRFFRIAPLFYLALALAFIIGPFLANDWYAIRAADGVFDDLTRFRDQSALNIFLHSTFLFGFLPEYATRTALPDWSIGLEMQFYLLFPLLFLLMKQSGPMKICLILGATCFAGEILFKEDLEQFSQPSFIALKLHMFLAGMLIAAAYFQDSKLKVFLMVIVAGLVGTIPFSHAIVPRLIDGSLIALLAGLALYSKFDLPSYVNATVGWLSHMLGNRFFHFIGEVSYSVYLLHFFIMIPTAGYLFGFEETLSSPVRFFLTLLITLPLTYGLGYLCLINIERPWIEIGRQVVTRMKNRKTAIGQAA